MITNLITKVAISGLIFADLRIRQKETALEAIKNPDCDWFYRASAADFKKIPGSPIAYWVGHETLNVLETSKKLGYIAMLVWG